MARSASAAHALGVLAGVAIGVFVGSETLVAVDVFVGMLVAVGWVGHATSTRQSPMPPRT
jgi:hypothetical protein